VLPSPSTHSLLIKSIAPGELLLPADAPQPQLEEPGETAIKTIENALDRVSNNAACSFPCILPKIIWLIYHRGKIPWEIIFVVFVVQKKIIH
jgi:hypothetical protein